MIPHPAAGETPYRRLDFESGLLGVGVYRLTDADALRSPESVAGIVNDLAEAGCWLAWARIPETDITAGAALAGGGFRPIECLVTFERPLTIEPNEPGVVAAGIDDAEGCAAIAHAAFSMDRLHRDPEISDDIADKVRRTWVLNNLRGRADATFIERVGDGIAGFINCLLLADAAVIDLIAVRPSNQGKGVGARLVRAALAHYAGRRPLMRVGTQADNATSLKLYQRAGFREVRREITFHRIFGQPAKRVFGGSA